MLARGAQRSGSVLLLAATLASLVVTITAGYLTRLSLIEASWWVTHTDEVKLAVTECQRAADHRNVEALRSSEAKVERLTLDNPRQQQSVARAGLLTDQGAYDALEPLFVGMQSEEDGLMAERLARIQVARSKSSAAFVIGMLLMVGFGGTMLVMLRAQRQDAARQRALVEAILESVDEGIMAVDTSRRMIAINAVARSMVGRSFPLGRLPEDWTAHIRCVYEDGTEMAPEDGPLARAMKGETSHDVVYRVVPASDPASTDAGVWVSATARPIKDDAGNVVVAVTTLRDVTDQRAATDRLRDLSSTDELTGLLNRRGFLANAHARIAADLRTRAPLALLYADVNGLKRVNDELGHERGDALIRDAADVLRGVLRERDVLSRLGGDEFVALLPGFSPAAGDALLERLTEAIRAHAEGASRPYRLSISAAVTFMDWERGQTLDELLADADQAMYTRKRARAGVSAPTLRAVPSSSKTKTS